MRVRMKVTISGTRDGQPWPAQGGIVDLPDEEAKQMVAAGLAAEPDDDSEDSGGEGVEEHATVPGTPEKATPAKKAAAKPVAQK
ncbi:hypothetical protein TUSST3_76630 [Streptomyces sp. TUS-ST3]|uniref:hypothetical protein n=1 Tax=Streptomyces sp. TUS-ST3 TaxID=3025591 RepID=UPI00235B5467|nr:hypothetical protein [Streptomyces sp. TUS-ST3]GLP71043.1 hypothetical protein TUSST3_76630 [Streptomyces sp. TUS-ST3]